MFGAKKIGRGVIEPSAIDDVAFNIQYQTYQRSGYAFDISSNNILGKAENYHNELQKDIDILNSNNSKKRKAKENEEGGGRSNKKLQALLSTIDYDSDDDDENEGPWKKQETQNDLPPLPLYVPPAKITTESANDEPSEKTEENTDDSNPNNSNVHILEPDIEDEKWEKHNERKQAFILPPRPQRGSQICEAKTTFHGESERDYQGRSWISAPQGVRPDDNEHDCYIPKKCVKRLTGHTKGVQSVSFFPKLGHLLLSCSMDGTAKIWDSHNEDFNLMRSYIGHEEGIRSMNFNNDGTQFLTSGFDRMTRVWDTETGQSVAALSNRKMNYCVRYYPINNNLFIAASSDNKIYQWDIRSGEMCQEYNHHLQPCNTVTFIDEGRKFISTSDDKKVLVWEFDIPVPIKYIAEPEMHCIPSMSHHPTQPFVAGQSMDNKIVVYTSGDKVRPYKKKTFRGHNNSGYACEIGFSPNGKFLMSGDGFGELYFWDWKTSKIFRKFHAHDSGPCMSAVWHPQHPTRVATCGWDGLIKIWE